MVFRVVILHLVRLLQQAAVTAVLKLAVTAAQAVALGGQMQPIQQAHKLQLTTGIQVADLEITVERLEVTYLGLVAVAVALVRLEVMLAHLMQALVVRVKSTQFLVLRHFMQAVAVAVALAV
jgi:hypothetical protein